MANIWGFLLWTLTLSLVAGLLLIIKWLLADKLSPRWQYGIWGLLVLRLAVPLVSGSKYILLPLSLWVEVWKSLGESGLHSAFSGPFDPVAVSWMVPALQGRPVSVTDWLYVVYTIGVLAFAIKYAVGYLALRLTISKGGPASPSSVNQIHAVAARYGLKPCSAKEVPGISSAFVCGVFRPVLVLPQNVSVDDKVMLHELLHLKYRDSLQGLIWCAVRCLNWCNPFMWRALDAVGNDMEALCDQRVLELLEGEERRDYGKILLSMANDKYPHAVGTSSISNGGANIAKRIKCIAHFKKYPKGMALVSVCIALVLVQPIMLGYGSEADFTPGKTLINDEVSFYRDLAKTRVARCTTVAGAIDTYAKGLMTENGFYIAAASPIEKQGALAAQMKAGYADGWDYTHLDNGFPGEISAEAGPKYYIFNLTEKSDETYEVVLAFHLDISAEKADSVPFADFIDDTLYIDIYNETDTCLTAFEIVPIEISKDKGWTAAEIAPRKVCRMPLNVISMMNSYDTDFVPRLAETQVTGKTGTLRTYSRTQYVINNTVQDSSQFDFFSDPAAAFNTTPILDAKFDNLLVHTRLLYDFTGAEAQRAEIYNAGSDFKLFYDGRPAEEYQMSESYAELSRTTSSGAFSSTDGTSGTYMTLDRGTWNGRIDDCITDYKDVPLKNKLGPYFGSYLPDTETLLPEGLTGSIYLNSKLVDTFTIEIQKEAK